MATATQTLREIISSHPGAAAILQQFDIDVCAHAGESLNEACIGLQLSVEQVLEKLDDGVATDAGARHADPADFSPTRLIRHIVRVHHRNVRQELPRLAELAQAVADKHRERMPALDRVTSLVEKLQTDLSEHIRKEEQVLFPYIAQVEQAPLLAFRPPQQCFSRVGQPVFMMAQEHERAKLLVAELRRLTEDFRPPVWACSKFVALYTGLRAFAGNLEEHVQLENDVLFPQAIALEAELLVDGAR